MKRKYASPNSKIPSWAWKEKVVTRPIYGHNDFEDMDQERLEKIVEAIPDDPYVESGTDNIGAIRYIKDDGFLTKILDNSKNIYLRKDIVRVISDKEVLRRYAQTQISGEGILSSYAESRLKFLEHPDWFDVNSGNQIKGD